MIPFNPASPAQAVGYDGYTHSHGPHLIASESPQLGLLDSLHTAVNAGILFRNVNVVPIHSGEHDSM